MGGALGSSDEAIGSAWQWGEGISATFPFVPPATQTTVTGTINILVGIFRFGHSNGRTRACQTGLWVPQYVLRFFDLQVE
jgi:hypothetical protein